MPSNDFRHHASHRKNLRGMLPDPIQYVSLKGIFNDPTATNLVLVSTASSLVTRITQGAAHTLPPATELEKAYKGGKLSDFDAQLLNNVLRQKVSNAETIFEAMDEARASARLLDNNGAAFGTDDLTAIKDNIIGRAHKFIDTPESGAFRVRDPKIALSQMIVEATTTFDLLGAHPNDSEKAALSKALKAKYKGLVEEQPNCKSLNSAVWHMRNTHVHLGLPLFEDAKERKTWLDAVVAKGSELIITNEQWNGANPAEQRSWVQKTLTEDFGVDPLEKIRADIKLDGAVTRKEFSRSCKDIAYRGVQTTAFALDDIFAAYAQSAGTKALGEVYPPTSAQVKYAPIKRPEQARPPTLTMQ